MGSWTRIHLNSVWLVIVSSKMQIHTLDLWVITRQYSQCGHGTCLLLRGLNNKDLLDPVQDQAKCRNYIRVLHKLNETTMYVCVTNAWRPACDYMVSALQDQHKTSFCKQPHLCRSLSDISVFIESLQWLILNNVKRLIWGQTLLLFLPPAGHRVKGSLLV